MFDRIKSYLAGIRKAMIGGGGQSFMNWYSGWSSKTTPGQLLYQYRNLVHQCIGVVSQNVARYQPIIKRYNAAGELVALKAHPFIQLLERPNETMSQYDLMEGTEVYKQLTGNAFWYLNLGQMTGKPKEIYLLRPDRMKIACDNLGKVIGYTLRNDDGTEIPLDANEVLHFKTFNPLNPYWGIGTVEANLLYVDTENITSTFQHSYIKNSANPSGILSFTGNIKQEAFDKLKKQWKEKYEGENNAGKTLLIRDTDANFTKVGLSIAELNLTDLKKITDEKVRNAFRVPKAMLGETDSTGLGRANVEAIEYVFAKYTVDPLQDKYDDMFTMAIQRYYKDDARVGHVSQVPEDKEFLLRERIAGVDNWITKNEARLSEGKPEMPGGDDLYVGFNQTPISAPTPTTTKSIKKKVFTLKRDAAQDTYFLALDKVELKADSSYRKKLIELLDKQKDDVISHLDAHGTKGIEKAFEDVTPDAQNQAQVFADELIPYLILAIQNSAPLALKYLNVDEQIKFILTQGMRDQIYQSGERLLKSFTQETTDKIQKMLIQGLNNHESLEQLTARIEDIYLDAKGYRARRIANTEAHKASNFGVREAYRVAGIKKMRWQARDDACEFCQAMNGTVVDVGSAFLPKGATVTGVDGGQYLADYTDVALADLHPNCRCQLVPIF